MEVKLIENITEIDSGLWNSLAGTDYPFIRHEFLEALELSGPVSQQTGWRARHLLVYDQGILVALMPLYLKFHSQGEYVFDQQWAKAHQQSDLLYYPKWLTAIPFTPCQGARIVIRNGLDAAPIIALIMAFMQQSSESHGISSWHCLFAKAQQAQQLSSAGLSLRVGVQFQWRNQNYRDFNDYLDSFTASKRKQVKRERKRAAEQDIVFEQIGGASASDRHWRVFFEFYQMTYLKRGMRPYLNLDFFQKLAVVMPEQLLLILAIKNHRYIGAALSLVGADTLYGRYWGCFEEYHSLHFETCYYQGLDYCLSHGLKNFDSGAQGEHKIARGFEPVYTYSAHWIKDPELAQAIDRFVTQERQAIEVYKEDAASHLPFKHQPENSN
ncbi:MAG: GNAT family N-acetyltransferase [Gammaproteobacteria bacterium HGW-Gammaproteobacteria-3]|nr:MAG: GNAT family N-acetyltransferase [Gammaproteobacteria bacterium HGW-Gammaproteobacteria-3]